MARDMGTRQSLGPTFAEYVTQLRFAWRLPAVAERAESCRLAMEQLFDSADPVWSAAMDRVAGEDRPAELYRDPDFGFIQMAHPYHPGHNSPPHGHGVDGWVVYGVQRGRVEIATYQAADSDPPLRTSRSELLGAGEARMYLPGELHSTRMVSGEGAEQTAVVLRLLSEDLSRLDRRRFGWQDVAAGG